MKRNIKLFTAILAVALVAGASIFYACEKENNSVANNPYDYLGNLHNEAMEKIIVLQDNPEFDLHSFSIEFMMDAMKEAKTDYSSEQWELLFDETLIEYEKFAKDSKSSISMQDGSYDVLELTNFQEKHAQKVFDIIQNSNDFESVKSKLIKVESDILKAPQDMDEKAFVLGLISIAKYSHDFWDNHEELIYEESIVKNFGVEDTAKKSYSQIALNCLEADAYGFLGGVVGSVISGHAAAATLVFGPAGTVSTVAAAGTISAIVSSGGAAIVQISNKKSK